MLGTGKKLVSVIAATRKMRVLELLVGSNTTAISHVPSTTKSFQKNPSVGPSVQEGTNGKRPGVRLGFKAVAELGPARQPAAALRLGAVACPASSVARPSC